MWRLEALWKFSSANTAIGNSTISVPATTGSEKEKRTLRLPDLEQSKNAVLQLVRSSKFTRIVRACHRQRIASVGTVSEPPLASNRGVVVLRYRFFLEQKNLAPSTINVRLAAVRRLAFEAVGTGLLSLELAAGIGRDDPTTGLSGGSLNRVTIALALAWP